MKKLTLLSKYSLAKQFRLLYKNIMHITGELI